MSQLRDASLQGSSQVHRTFAEYKVWVGDSGTVNEVIYSPVRAGKEHLGYLIVLAFCDAGEAARAMNTLATTALVRFYFDGARDAVTNLRNAFAAAKDSVKALSSDRSTGIIPMIIAVSIIGGKAYIVCEGKGCFLRTRGNTLSQATSFTEQTAVDIAPGDRLFIWEGDAPRTIEQQHPGLVLRGDLLAAASEVNPDKKRTVLAIGLPPAKRTLQFTPIRLDTLRWGAISFLRVALATVVFLILTGFSVLLYTELRNPQQQQTQTPSLSPSSSGAVAAITTDQISHSTSTPLLTVTSKPTDISTPSIPRPTDAEVPTEQSGSPATATATPSASATVTATPSASATATATLTATNVLPPTLTGIATSTPTASITPTPTAIPTASPTPTITAIIDREGISQINDLPFSEKNNVVTPGSTVTFRIEGFRSKEYPEYWVTSPDGKTDLLLSRPKTNANGVATWTWSVPQNAQVGPWVMNVSDGYVHVAIYVNVQAPA